MRYPISKSEKRGRIEDVEYPSQYVMYCTGLDPLTELQHRHYLPTTQTNTTSHPYHHNITTVLSCCRSCLHYPDTQPIPHRQSRSARPYRHSLPLRPPSTFPCTAPSPYPAPIVSVIVPPDYQSRCCTADAQSEHAPSLLRLLHICRPPPSYG
jgi:hypothetical protein